MAMGEMRKPVVGETLFVASATTLTTVKVLKVGLKYFTVGAEGAPEHMHVRYLLGTWREVSRFGQRVLYESEQVWKDETEERVICGRLSTYFQYGGNCKNIPLSMLREINSIIADEVEQ